MAADLDTLATALYARADDLLKSHRERVPYRPEVGIAPQISDAEIITLAVMQALLGHTSEAEDVPSLVELGWRSGLNSMRRLRQFVCSRPCRGGRAGGGLRRAGASACSP